MMLQMPSMKSKNWNYIGMILSFLFFSMFYLYLLFQFNPLLSYEQQQPVFFFSQKFLHEFLNYPGGLSDYISAMFSQYYFIPWIGALIITAIALGICLATKGIIKSVLEVRQVYLVHLLPAVILLCLHQHYKHPLAFDIALLISLSFYNLFFRLIPGKLLIRMPLFLLMSVILYYLTGGAFLLFALLSIILELFIRRRYELAAGFLLFSALLIYGATRYFLLTKEQSAFTYLINTNLEYSFRFLPELLYLYFPLLMVLTIIYKLGIPKKTKENLLNKISKAKLPLQILYPIILFGGGWLLLDPTFNSSSKTFLEIENYARFGKWEEIINAVKPEMLNHKIIAFQLNRALFHTGKLSDELFSYPQLAGNEGLFLSTDLGATAPLERSDLFFELGFVNESRHWAFEAVATHGYTPSILIRLIEISILKGEAQFAKECVNMLSKTILFRENAAYYNRILQNESLLQSDKRLSKIKSLMSKSDFIVKVDYPHLDLISLIKENKTNKMAFEYLMAYYLVTRQLNKFVENYYRMAEFNYAKVPRHFEEAMLAYGSINKTVDLKTFNYQPSAEANMRFQEFYKTLRNYRGDKVAAQSTIQMMYGNTYWAYLLYK